MTHGSLSSLYIPIFKLVDVIFLAPVYVMELMRATGFSSDERMKVVHLAERTGGIYSLL